ncbi:putative neutral ceramidase superfamily lipid hydrolase [Bacillus iocasae]|uniref:Neutral ceramidase superfamily lipid hydrolase n=2 Tax=Priestia iocasae TaxID=2291674 RepID=A0ABS2QY20_9BACI|nr:putative neutral ceramidase superfamily lipid hydrolase [Metabacillus iocasae]
MIIWFRHLPHKRIELSEWTPFIQNNWYRKHYMKFVYLLQLSILLIPSFFSTEFTTVNIFLLIIIGILVFILHEYLHILVINKKGDSSLTFSGIFFWLHTNAILSKGRFWVFMSLPFLVLSVVPAITSFYALGNLKLILLFISWFNTLISSSDIINSFLIAIKPKNTVFCRGYYRIK